MKDWWKDYFDEIYLRIYPHSSRKELTLQQVDLIERALNLEKGTRILDLACGFGRHSIELAKRGYNVTGLDYSSFLIELAREKVENEKVNVEFIQADMRTMDFHEEFDAVINMFTSWGYFSDEENFDILKRVCRALKRGGRFLLDFFNPLMLFKHMVEKSWYSTGDIYVLEDVSLDPIKMRITNKRIVIEKGGVIDRREHSVRIYTNQEITWLLKQAGLQYVTTYGDFDGNEYNEKSRRMIILAQKLKKK